LSSVADIQVEIMPQCLRRWSSFIGWTRPPGSTTACPGRQGGGLPHEVQWKRRPV